MPFLPSLLLLHSLAMFAPPLRWPAPRRRPRGAAALGLGDLLDAAAEGDLAANIEAVSLLAASAVGVAAARSLIDEGEPPPPPPPPPDDDSPDDTGLVAVSVDLGQDGEPAGVARLNLRPRRRRSDILLLERMRLPLGLVIEEVAGEIVVTGALPGYGAVGQAAEGDVVRGLTAWAPVLAGSPMWQQVTSGTPLGTRQLKRVLFSADGATFGDVRGAIASHRADAGGDGYATLIVERVREEGEPAGAVSPSQRPSLEPLGAVLARDLRLPAGGDAAAAAGVDQRTWAERAGALLGGSGDEDDEGGPGGESRR